MWPKSPWALGAYSFKLPFPRSHVVVLQVMPGVDSLISRDQNIFYIQDNWDSYLPPKVKNEKLLVSTFRFVVA